MPSALTCSAGTIVTVVPAGAEPVIAGSPDRLAPKSSTYVGPGTLATLAPSACALVSAGVTVTPVPASRTVTPAAWAAVSAGVNVTPVPVAPCVPTEVTVTTCWAAPSSISSGCPTMKLVVPTQDPPALHAMPTLATLMLVSPAAAGAARVVAGPAPVPTAVTLRASIPDPLSMLIVSPG